ncbi:uncharacterized protein [Nothobranchius furzeri]|uniref:uncharacterized protein n=1 Tax=Nothobranchius furzeri TaxID=105023 RepID=UPI0039047E5F
MNKTFILKEFFVAQGLELLCICESWLPMGDSSALLELLPVACSCFNVPRSSGRDGGLVVYKSHFNCKQLILSNPPSSFEMCLSELGPPPLLLVALIYRPPKFDVDFLKDFSDLLSVNMLKYDHVLILGDFNIHVCCPDKPLAKVILHLLGSLNLSQWVLGPTHAQGHTLDLVLSIGLSVAGVEILSPVFSDHSPILCDFNLPCVSAVASSHVRFCRVLNAAKVIELGELLCAEGSELHTMSLNAEELTLQFDSICKNILDRIAPLRIRKPRPRPEPWLSDDVRACRRAERKWKKDRLQVSREIFRESLFSYQQTLKEARVKFFADIVEKNSHDPRSLCSVVNSLLEFSDSSSLPPTGETCNDFLHFFVDTVRATRAAITNSPSDSLLPE